MNLEKFVSELKSLHKKLLKTTKIEYSSRGIGPKIWKMSAAHALLVWQYVRFNKRYQKDFQNLSREDDESGLKLHGRKDAFCNRWSIEKPSDFVEWNLPNGVSFYKRSPVRGFSARSFKRSEFSASLLLQLNIDSVDDVIQSSLKKVAAGKRPEAGQRIVEPFSDLPFEAPRGAEVARPIVLIVNPLANTNETIETVRCYLDAERRLLKTFGYTKRYDVDGIRGRSYAGLLGNFVLYYLRKELKKDRRSTEKIYNEIFDDPLHEFDDAEMDRRVNSFVDLSRRAPWVFLSPAKP